MSKKGKEILSRFIADEDISTEELSRLQKWLTNDLEVEQVLWEEWNKGDEKETDVKFLAIQNEIWKQKKPAVKKSVFRKILMNYQKLAAIFLIPVVAVSFYFVSGRFNSEPTYFQTSAARGQKSHVELPDGTNVWLNSDSKIIYPDNFGRKSRGIQLIGEAYFEVTKNENKPFVVEAGRTRIKVLGTTFNLRAYPDENEVETTLFKGKVELVIQPEKENTPIRSVEIKPGESLIFNHNKNELQYGKFESEEILGWTNNQLIFRNESFEDIAKKIERWYDVDIIYDEASLNDQRLTVELYQGELLYRLLDIIELAIDVECVSEKDKIFIKTKKE